MLRSPPFPEVRVSRSPSPSPYVSLFLALFVQLTILALAPSPGVQQVANLILTAWMAWALVSLSGKRRDGVIAFGLGALPALLGLVIPAEATPRALELGKDALWAAFPFFLGIRLLKRLFQAKRVSHREFCGALAVYILLGLGFANVYEIYYGLDPKSLGFAHTALGGAPAFTDFVYFSFVTIATLGYGDVAPVTPAARLTAVVEAVVGLLYVAVLVGRMVGLQIASTDRERSSGTSS